MSSKVVQDAIEFSHWVESLIRANRDELWGPGAAMLRLRSGARY